MRVLRIGVGRNGYLLAVLCIASSTGLFLLGRAYFAKGQWVLLYLLIIGLVAGLSGDSGPLHGILTHRRLVFSHP